MALTDRGGMGKASWFGGVPTGSPGVAVVGHCLGQEWATVAQTGPLLEAGLQRTAAIAGCHRRVFGTEWGRGKGRLVEWDCPCGTAIALSPS